VLPTKKNPEMGSFLFDRRVFNLHQMKRKSSEGSEREDEDQAASAARWCGEAK
jgi:hypothetical protein